MVAAALSATEAPPTNGHGGSAKTGLSSPSRNVSKLRPASGTSRGSSKARPVSATSRDSSNQLSESQLDVVAEVPPKAYAGPDVGMIAPGVPIGTSMAEQQEQQDEVAGITVLNTNFKQPFWFETLMAATGILDFTFKIEQERQRRSDEVYMNPYPMTERLVTSIGFEVAVAAMIVVNCTLIGWEASEKTEAHATLFSVCEHLFVGFFMVEWLLRIVAFGWVWMFEFANLGDTVLVWVCGVFFKWILEPLGVDIGPTRVLTVLRAARLAHLAKSTYSVPAMRSMWVIVRGLIHSARPVLWTLVIGFMIIYIFGLAATVLIGDRSPWINNDLAQDQFGNILRSVFTMLQLFTMDTWADDIVRPTMEGDSSIVIFFLCFIMLAVFVFQDLVFAIIVDNARWMEKQDHSDQAREVEIEKKKSLTRLAELFLQIDKDKSGELSLEEFADALTIPKVRHLISLIGTDEEQMKELWSVLDDGDGVLDIKEFANGLRRMRGPATAKDLRDVVKRLRHCILGHSHLQAQMNQFDNTLHSLESDVRKIANDTGEVVGLLQEMSFRLAACMQGTS